MQAGGRRFDPDQLHQSRRGAQGLGQHLSVAAHDSLQPWTSRTESSAERCSSLTIREGKGAFGLDESSNAQRVELYLARARETQKARAGVGANTLVTSFAEGWRLCGCCH